QESPEHQYTQKGEFEITLIVTDNGGLTGSATKTIQVGNAKPIAAFSFTPSPARVGEVVRFTNESTDDGDIVACFWEFGDGATSAQCSPEYVYSSTGTFAVKLTVIDDDNVASSITREIEIINLPPEVEIVRPVAGQVLTGEAMIEWEAFDPDDDADTLKITLEYEPASGGDWQAIASEAPNTGKYIWDTSKLERGGKYRIRITAVDPEGASGDATSEEFTVIALTRAVVAAPNPTSDVVTFYYDIASDGTLYVYDIAGRLVHSAELSATANAHEWNLHSSGKPVANGVYLYVVIAGEERSEVGRLVVSR
ncbi:MAG TPA: PKD domain-containing protein, partial [Bacillota bacterium]|nr:PKD domain-containing protein [Bacillota bacterium]